MVTAGSYYNAAVLVGRITDLYGLSVCPLSLYVCLFRILPPAKFYGRLVFYP